MAKEKAAATYAEQKRQYRQKMRAAGYKEISVWVAPEQAEAVRAFAESRPKPSRGPIEGQMDWIDHLAPGDE